ncbi:hypothetical protein SAMN05421720_102130 [Rhodospira trueperi]|uniref:Uncharacterized protein n=1 Tax=Rhodospira trueperi TaxID=69960 RepID=A0A1G6YWD4_9PROT|nr:hypothetical protein SAMN05421720_102130 [Rhodospira trueperi]
MLGLESVLSVVSFPIMMETRPAFEANRAAG